MNRTTLAVTAGTSLALLAAWLFKRHKAVKLLAENKAAEHAAASKAPQDFMHRKERKRKPMTLEKIEEISHDTRRFIFKLEHQDQCLGLPTGNHIKLYAPNCSNDDSTWNGQPDADKGEEIERKYTPTSLVTDTGKVALVVKVYRAGQPERFCDGGKMSQYLAQLQLQDTIDVRGPFGNIKYTRRGEFVIGGKPRHAKNIGMLAGGTGITPMLQIMQTIENDAEDTTDCSLLFGNQTPDDILCKDELQSLKKRFSLWYTVDRTQEQPWPPEHQANCALTLSTGFIDQEKIQHCLPAPGDDTIVLLCGPPAMVNHLSKNILKKLGYKEDQIHAF